MRIVYVLLSPTFGMHQYTADLANRLVTEHDIYLVTTTKLPYDRYCPTIEIHTPLTSTGTGLSLEGLRFGQAGDLARYIMQLRPGLIHFTGPHLWNVPLVRHFVGQGIPTVHTLHDLDPHKGTRLKALLHIWNSLIIRSADHILVHGQQYRQRLLSSGLQPEKVTYTPLLHLFLSYERNLTLSELERCDGALDVTYEPFILFFGRLEGYKGVDYLLTAYAELTSAMEYAERAGSTTPGMPELVLAGAGPLSALWVGNVPRGVQILNELIGDRKALDLFRRCSLVVLPYVDATQSALIPAAYFFRKPVIVTRAGALPEYVDDQRTGFVVEPDHPPSLARAMAVALQDPDRLRQMGETGRAWYEQRRRDETKSLLFLYKNAAGGRTAAPSPHLAKGLT